MSTKFSYGSSRTVLVPAAMAALLLGATVAGCGSATSSAAAGNPPASTAAPDGGSQGSTAGGSPAGGSPTGGSSAGGSQAAAPQAPPSSPASQADPAFPAEPDGVTFSGGVAGGVDAFSIAAGRYVENTQASYDPANDPSRTGECLFSGEFDYLSGSGWSAPLGGAAPLTDMSPINGPAVGITLAAGDYKIYIYPETTCSWTIELLPSSA
jgi:hypothetical protein